MPLELEIDEPESRQVTLPDSVPVGKVKVTVQTAFDPTVPIPRTSDKNSASGWRSTACYRSC